MGIGLWSSVTTVLVLYGMESICVGCILSMHSLYVGVGQGVLLTLVERLIMGYYVDYRLVVEDMDIRDSANGEPLHDVLNQYSPYDWCDEGDAFTFSAKNFNAEDAFRKISRIFPGVVFTVYYDIEGSSPGYGKFKDNKFSGWVGAEIIYPPISESDFT